MFLLLVACTTFPTPFVPSVPPAGFSTHGIDVSAWQRTIEWPTVAGSGEVDFVFVKATEGRSHVDRRFAHNWEGARQAGLQAGAYHYFSACRTGEEQAAHFIATVPREPDALPPVLDVEVDGRCNGESALREAVTDVELWLDRVEDHFGVRPLVYASDGFHRDVLGDVSAQRWVASWSRSPRRTADWTVWQHTDRGAVPGIRGPVDRNVLQGDTSWTLEAR